MTDSLCTDITIEEDKEKYMGQEGERGNVYELQELIAKIYTPSRGVTWPDLIARVYIIAKVCCNVAISNNVRICKRSRAPKKSIGLCFRPI